MVYYYIYIDIIHTVYLHLCDVLHNNYNNNVVTNGRLATYCLRLHSVTTPLLELCAVAIVRLYNFIHRVGEKPGVCNCCM